MTHTESPARTSHDYAVERDRLDALCDAARERWNVARFTPGTTEDIGQLYGALIDLIAERDVAARRYRRARIEELAAAQATPVTKESAPAVEPAHIVKLADNVEVAAERLRIARGERDYEDTIADLRGELIDARNELAAARAELASGGAFVPTELDARDAARIASAYDETARQRRELANTIAQQAEALAAGTFVGVESAHVARLLSNAETLRAWTPTA